MPTILALTVGGSCAPVVTAIKDYQPDFVLFLVSTGPRGSRVTVDGEGQPCRGFSGAPDLPNILTQTGLAQGNYHIKELTDPDSLNLCYAEVKDSLAEVAALHPDARQIADYTGGTKTMTAALTLAAVEMGWALSLVKGARTDLVQVVPGTEMASLVNAWELRSRQHMGEARGLFNNYAYASAGELLESLPRLAPLSLELQRVIRQWVGLCRGFDAWDRFDHQLAYQVLEPYQSSIVPQWIFLKKLVGKTSSSGYEVVFDLLLNAERRAARGRYDDAVARLYRATEMLAQIRLAKRDPPLNTKNLEIELLPPELQPRYQEQAQFNQALNRSGVIKLGLVDAYDLLSDLGDPLRAAYDRQRDQIKSALQKRNNSILAHGNDPLEQADYLEMKTRIESMIENGLSALGVARVGVQFPALDESGVVQRGGP